MSGTVSGTVSGSGSGTASGSGTGSGSVAVAHVDAGTPKDATAVAMTPDAGTARIDAGTSVTPITSQAMAVVVIDSAPQGADLFGPGNVALGKTPAKLSLPVTAKALTYELRLAGYRKKTKEFVVTGNAVIEVSLERVPVIIRHNGGRGSGKHSGSDDLERP